MSGSQRIRSTFCIIAEMKPRLLQDQNDVVVPAGARWPSSRPRPRDRWIRNAPSIARLNGPSSNGGGRGPTTTVTVRLVWLRPAITPELVHNLRRNRTPGCAKRQPTGHSSRGRPSSLPTSPSAPARDIGSGDSSRRGTRRAYLRQLRSRNYLSALRSRSFPGSLSILAFGNTA
jgi:hypothetical protein